MNFSLGLLDSCPFVHEKDWDLGDIVTTQNKEWGVTMDERVTEVTETYERSGFRLDAVFGNDSSTMMDKIRRIYKDSTVTSRG